MMKLQDSERQGVLYALLLLAAIGVIALAAVSTAAIVGWLPVAHSISPFPTMAAWSSPGESRASEPGRAVAMPAVPRAAAPATAAAARGGAVEAEVGAPCAYCATVVSVRAIAVEGSTSGLGAIAGGVLGGVLGNQVGGGRGRAVATVAGAGGGAFVGNEVEKGMNRQTRYRVTVRTDEGVIRSVDETSGGWKPGDRVVLHGGGLAPVAANR
jgi:outer membrane lipoprotein SlyB